MCSLPVFPSEGELKSSPFSLFMPQPLTPSNKLKIPSYAEDLVFSFALNVSGILWSLTSIQTGLGLCASEDTPVNISNTSCRKYRSISFNSESLKKETDFFFLTKQIYKGILHLTLSKLTWENTGSGPKRLRVQWETQRYREGIGVVGARCWKQRQPSVASTAWDRLTRTKHLQTVEWNGNLQNWIPQAMKRSVCFLHAVQT